ncbi:MAG: tRNA (adenosine(37)-N6)-threonylcarbamoyltransferase complex transferase subunit TsaD [Planctomycetota bacterium]|nr:tRNA (adenosine(37)-N6)-threonylcarbamoyltransferase complex transferase subunit TsaD [Planctomycetota bacterium]
MTTAGTNPPRRLLAIETSCDETAAAVVDENLRVLSNVVSSQTGLHKRFGGVVPEVASRAHVDHILLVIEQALADAGTRLDDLAAVAVVTHPGLVGSLLVGLTAAKTLALLLEKPLIPVNHIEAHLFACRMHAERDVFPAIGLVVSGGHCNLYDCQGGRAYELLGSTIDDAVGEAFDKVASMLGLSYPGGPSIQKAAESGNRKRFKFPRSFERDRDRLEFSFSGLKTSVLYEIAGKPPRDYDPKSLDPHYVADIAASFQEAAIDVLVTKSRQALAARGRSTLCVGGGVAANARLRERLAAAAREDGFELILAPMAMCTDNAAMSAIAWELLAAGQTAELDVDVTSGLVRRKPAGK